MTYKWRLPPSRLRCVLFPLLPYLRIDVHAARICCVPSFSRVAYVRTNEPIPTRTDEPVPVSRVEAYGIMNQFFSVSWFGFNERKCIFELPGDNLALEFFSLNSTFFWIWINFLDPSNLASNQLTRWITKELARIIPIVRFFPIRLLQHFLVVTYHHFKK